MHQENFDKTHTAFGGSLLSSGLALAVIALAFGSLRLWNGVGLTIMPPTAYSILLSVLLMGAGVVVCVLRSERIAISPGAFGIAAACIIVTDKFDRGFNLLQGPLIKGEILLFALLGVWVLRKKCLPTINFAMLLTPVLLIYCFSAASNNQLIYIDDHATFLYRLILLKENFPSIPFYSPHWNAGIDARDFFATGALNIFALFSPLIYLFDVESIYNLIVALLLFGLLPVVIYITARLEGLKQPVPALAVVLSLTTSVTWYRWALHYGTLGFVTTCILSPLALTLAVRIVSRDLRTSGALAVLTFFTVTLMLFWSPSGLAFAPLIGIALLRLPTVLRKPWIALLTAALVVANISWILIFWSAANVSHYLETDEPLRVSEAVSTPEDTTDNPAPIENGHTTEVHDLEQPAPPTGFIAKLKGSLKTLRHNANSANPLLILMFLPGIALLRQSSRLPWALYLSWLLFLGTIAVPYIPALDLDRMLVFFSLAATIPCASALIAFWRRAELRRELIPFGAILFGMLIAAIFSTGSTVRNRGNFHYSFKTPLVSELSDAIRHNHQGGRVLFAGFVLHEFNGAHLAPLAHFTGVPLMASSYVHRYWEYTEIVPVKFLAQKRTGGIERYFDLYNVGALIAHEPKWREYLSNRPQLYTRVWSKGRFSMYARNEFRSSFFLTGQGRVIKETSNSVTLELNETPAIIKYRHFPFVTSSACSLSGSPVEDGTSFIKLEGCPAGSRVTISSLPPHTRISL